MAKDRKKLQHMHSSIPDKQPTPASLEVGEIAVNNAAEQEFLSVKNTDNKVVRFSSDGQIIEWIERKEVMPYKGYVRGEGGPTTTSGDTPTSDDKGSYGVTNKNLLENKSQLVFKLNQVAADLTTKHDKVNGADDMFGKEINPTDDYGVNDGAGFFIDMSRYAMIDGNPSFSALTATCQTTLSGNTFIRDGASANTYGTDTGHTLDIKVTNNVVSGVTWDETLSAKTESISGRTTTIGNNGENLHVIGKTIEVHDGDVTITNKSNVTENTTGTTTINNTGKTTVNVVHGTEINSCDGISANTNTFIVKQCSGTRGKAQFDFCDGFTVNSDDVKITECTPDGSIVITEKNATVNAENTTINDRGNTVINTSGNSSANTTGNVVVNTTGTTTIDRNGNVSENNQHNVTVVTSGNNTTTISGNTITNVSGNTTADTGGNVVVMTSGTTTETKGGNVTENNQSNKTENTTGNVIVNTTGTTTETKGGVVTENNLSDKTENTTGDHSLYVTGNTCVTSQKTARFYGKVSTEIGVACDGTPASATSVIGTDTLKMSGTTTTLSANSTTIDSCGDVTINTNELKVKQCGNAGSAEFDFCTKFAVNSSDVDITQCGDNGSITITEETVKINAGDTTINDSGDTTINTGGETKIITEDGTTIQTTAGDTNINTTGDTNITSTSGICVVADKTAAFVGTVKTNIGKNCADGGQTTTLNINGDTINETGKTVNISATTNVNISANTICESATTAANFYGATTNIGVSCGGTTAGTINVSGTTINEGGTTNNNTFTTINDTTTNYNIDTTNYDLDGSVICISGSTNSNFYGKETNIGVDCGGTTATTVNVSGTTINEGGTTNNNEFTTVNNTATTINNSTTNYNINTTNYDLNGSVICVSGSTNTDVYGKTTNIGVDCGGTTATTVNISGTTINEGGTNLNQNVTNYDLNGSVICISGSTNTDVYGKTTNIGVDCGGTTATTVNVSGTTINEGGTTNNNTFTTVNNTATTINNNTTNYNITGTTNISGNTTIDGTLNVSGVTTIGDTLIIKKGLEKTLSWEYGSVCNEPTSATSTNFKDDAKFIIPKTLSDVSCGVVDLTDGCLNINKNICVTGKIEVSNGVFNTSDRRLKENIKRVGFEKMLAAHNVSIQQFNYLNDGDKRLTYGVIAQEVQERNIPEVIYLNEEGYMSVDYTSLMILKIAYLENEVERLTNKLGQVLEKLDNK